MPTYTIRGIDVDFPFQAYDCQIVYMDKVIQSLQQKSNALLESPTGTGKTLCLLCATLAWRKSVCDFTTTDGATESELERYGCVPKIVYTSRTHSQLKQVIRELKLTSYRPKMTILGSREQFCIHDEVTMLNGRARDNACHYMRKKRACTNFARVNEFVKRYPAFGKEPFDIEDLVTFGRSKGPCPYYVSRELHKVADIIFAPYNYLVDPKRRDSLTGILWSDTILIFDEAHNLEGICSDAASFDLPSSHVIACVSEAKQCMDLASKRPVDKSSDKQCDPDQFAILAALLLKLEKHMEEVAIESKELGFTRPGPYIYKFLSEMNITLETANMLISTIGQAVLLLEEAHVNASRKKGTVSRLEGFKDILEIIFPNGRKNHSQYYRFHVQEFQQKVNDFVKGKASRTLSWWCFNPGIAMEEFKRLGVPSIIVTSGTLSPLNSFAAELKIEFPIRLENPHVVKSDQVWVGVVPVGPSGVLMNSSFRNRESLEYKQDLGNAIVNFARVVPDGLLVFFPSYYLMEHCIEFWKKSSHVNATEQSTIWERICRHKQPVVEPKQSALFALAIEDFEVKLRGHSSGAVFFAVCRGKVSEGLDFADHAGRAVVITGMPFAMRNDPKVRLKREYLDEHAFSQKNCKVLSGEDWYLQQATRAVNQAVGRVIRHSQDYGAIIFCDERFSHQNNQNQMSYWIRPHVKCYSVFGEAIFTLTRFFRDRSACASMNPKQAKKLAKGGPLKEKVSHTLEKTLSPEPFNNAAVATDDLRNRETCIIDDISRIVPANRSHLSSSQIEDVELSRPRNFLSSRKRMQTSGQSTSYHKELELIDLTNEPCKDELGTGLRAPCSLKKSKQDDTSPEHSTQSYSLELGNSSRGILIDRISDKQHDHLKPEMTNRGWIGSRASLELQPQKKKIHHLASISDGTDTKGSAFLVQVKEKLSAAEYKEFIGFMKALKSKTMKIMHVLESITKLFSVPGRLFLLRRFKDYVPVKYQPLYEQYVKASETISDNEQ